MTTGTPACPAARTGAMSALSSSGANTMPSTRFWTNVSTRLI